MTGMFVCGAPTGPASLEKDTGLSNQREGKKTIYQSLILSLKRSKNAGHWGENSGACLLNSTDSKHFPCPTWEDDGEMDHHVTRIVFRKKKLIGIEKAKTKTRPHVLRVARNILFLFLFAFQCCLQVEMALSS